MHMPAMATMLVSDVQGWQTLASMASRCPVEVKLVHHTFMPSHNCRNTGRCRVSAGTGCPVVGAVPSADGSAQLPPGHPALPTERQMSSIPNGVLSGDCCVQRPRRWQQPATALLTAVCFHAACIPQRLLLQYLLSAPFPQAPMKHRNTRAARTTGGCTPRSSSSTTPCGARAGPQTQGT